MNYQELKALARRADRARGEERKRLVEKLIKELPKLGPFESFGKRAMVCEIYSEVELGSYLTDLSSDETILS
ncbi:hypothetical protein ES703_36961 [subsurface metagenome]